MGLALATARLEGTCKTRPGTDPLRSGARRGPVAQTCARPDLLRWAVEPVVGLRDRLTAE
jgi:hypothetical protein